MLDHVMRSVVESSNYLNSHTHRNGIICKVFLLIPYGDRLMDFKYPNMEIIQGLEKNVLSRYLDMWRSTKCDYVARITSDCPLIPSSVISKSIMTAVKGHYDYICNGWEGYRTFFDGADTEVLSAKAMQVLSDNAEKSHETEHVTIYLRENKLPQLKMGHIFSNLDTSHLKLSVDTQEDLENVRAYYSSYTEKITKWRKDFGRENTHRF